MRSLRLRRAAVIGAFATLAACHHDKVDGPSGATCALTPVSTSGSVTTIDVAGCAVVSARFTAEVAVRGTTAYTTTWGGAQRVSGVVGDQLNIWDVSGAMPVLADSIIVSGVGTLGDVEVSDDGKLLVVATERANGAIITYDLTDPRKPKQLSRFTNTDTYNGVHTAKLGRVNGTLYAFLAIDPYSLSSSPSSKVVIVDLSDPSNPHEVYAKQVSTSAPFAHDTYPRDGLLFVALWDQGMEIWDIGGGGHGGTPSNPVVLGGTPTIGGSVHNIWWYHDAVTGSKQYAFVGEENGPAQVGISSTGDIHVVDVSDMAHPHEVAFFHVPGAGTHNFSVDEQRGILYAAYYNGGVRALNVRGDLSTCTAAQQTTVNGLTRCDLGAMGREVGRALASGTPPVYVWGVQYTGHWVYASDMLNGLWKLKALE